MIFTERPGASSLTPVFLSTVTPGKLPTFWLRPVSALKRELFPLLGLPTSAIWRLFFFNLGLRHLIQGGKGKTLDLSDVTKCGGMCFRGVKDWQVSG